MRVGSAIVQVDAAGALLKAEPPAPKVTESPVTFTEKCRKRAAARFGVEVSHLMDSYKKLSGKKIDGLLINDILDRHGVMGRQTSRHDLATKCNVTLSTVEYAEEKLGLILKEANVQTAYLRYVQDMVALLKAEAERDAIMGG